MLRPTPRPLVDPQELARCNNDHEAAFRAKEAKRKARRRRGRKSANESNLQRAVDDLVGALDERAAERAARPVRAVGFFPPGKAGSHSK